MSEDFDAVEKPKHYNSHPSGIECIQITEHMSFNLGNVIKYCWRTDHKNGIEDLKKAQWYLSREIERLEGGKADPADQLFQHPSQLFQHPSDVPLGEGE